MSIPKLSLSCFFLLLVVVAPIHGFETNRKLDEAGLPGSTDPSIKCGGCSPCSATCYLSPPPPPPQLYLPPPPPPPPHKKPPKTRDCPPSPPYSGGFIYTGAPPGSLYPVDQNYSGSTRPSFSSSVNFALLVYGFLLSSPLILWP